MSLSSNDQGANTLTKSGFGTPPLPPQTHTYTPHRHTRTYTTTTTHPDPLILFVEQLTHVVFMQEMSNVINNGCKGHYCVSQRNVNHVLEEIPRYLKLIND